MKDPNALYPGQKILIANKTAIPSKGDHKKPIKISKINIDRTQAKKDSLKDKSEITSGDSFPEQTLKIVRNSKNSGRLNKNRPAFMPVSFSSEKQESVGTITVDFDETLSHYADWALLSIRELKKINKIKGRGKIVVHDKLRVSFKKVNPDKFEERRQEYHKGIQEDFFNNYDIRELTIRSVEKGETLWEICNEIYTIPLWLLSSYNSDKNIHSLAVGEPIVVPVIYPKTG